MVRTLERFSKPQELQSKGNNPTRVTVRLSEEEVNVLKIIAQREGCTITRAAEVYMRLTLLDIKDFINKESKQ